MDRRNAVLAPLAIGIRTRLQPTDWLSYLKLLGTGKFQVGPLETSADYPAIGDFLYPLFESKSSRNKADYSSSAFDEEALAAGAITDPDERAAKYQELNKGVQATNPVAPLVFSRHDHVASARVHDLVYSAQGLTDFATVWLANGGAK